MDLTGKKVAILIESDYYEHEIWYTIKNVGSREVDVDIYASIVS